MKKTTAKESLRERNKRAAKLSMKYGGLGFVGCRAEADVLGFVPEIGGTGDKELKEPQWKLFANAFNLRCKLHQHTKDSGNPEYKPFDFSAYSEDETKLAIQQLARERSNCEVRLECAERRMEERIAEEKHRQEQENRRAAQNQEHEIQRGLLDSKISQQQREIDALLTSLRIATDRIAGDSDKPKHLTWR